MGEREGERELREMREKRKEAVYLELGKEREARRRVGGAMVVVVVVRGAATVVVCAQSSERETGGKHKQCKRDEFHDGKIEMGS